VTSVPFDNDVERASAETFDVREPQNDDAEDGAPGHPIARLPANVSTLEVADLRQFHAITDDDVYIDDRRLANMLGCSRVTLQQARVRGEGIPYIKIGRLVRYSTRTIREWLAIHTRGTTRPVRE
jgi:Helix-turn-helix domain